MKYLLTQNIGKVIFNHLSYRQYLHRYFAYIHASTANSTLLHTNHELRPSLSKRKIPHTQMNK